MSVCFGGFMLSIFTCCDCVTVVCLMRDLLVCNCFGSKRVLCLLMGMMR